VEAESCARATAGRPGFPAKSRSDPGAREIALRS
jgi:hypothetical protein